MFIVLATGIIMGWILNSYYRHKTSEQVDRNRSEMSTALNDQSVRADTKQSDRK